jgi:radical SAM superfamily enzyme YgiQ (UPF0313 family)
LSTEHILEKGEVLTSEEWALPDVTEIPYESYNYMYKNDFNKFCGIPNRQELVVPIARGCPVGCSFCDVPSMQGRFERRLSVERTVDYIQESFRQLPFEYVSFYAPTFTLNHKWVKSLCKTLISLDRKYPWKCVTVLKMLDEQLIALMSQSGCVRISLGIESFTNGSLTLPKVKQDTLSSFVEIARICKTYNVELNCFIILGLPGDTPAEVRNTIEICLEHGARVRPTIYTPYHHIDENIHLREISNYNRQLFPPELLSAELEKEYYNIFYNNQKDKFTTVMENIEPSQPIPEPA